MMRTITCNLSCTLEEKDKVTTFVLNKITAILFKIKYLILVKGNLPISIITPKTS